MALVKPTIHDLVALQGYSQELYKYLAIFGNSSPLVDPDADRILFWDDSADQVTWLTVGTGLSISGTTLTNTITQTTDTNGLVLIDTKTASASATLDFTSGLTSTYETYIFDLVDIVPATDDVGFWIRISQDAGSNWKSGASDYSWTSAALEVSSSIDNDFSDSEIEIVSSALGAGKALGNASGESLSGMIRFQNPASTAIKKKFSSSALSYVDAAGNPTAVTAAGFYATDNSAINGVRFLMESGNITSGTIRLYGVAKS